MDFAKNINRICAERGTTLTAIVKTVKGSSSFTTQINRGSLPKEHEMVEMARLLGCTVMDFFADDDGNSAIAIQLNEDELEIIRMFRDLTLKEKHMFMAQAYTHEREALQNKE